MLESAKLRNPAAARGGPFFETLFPLEKLAPEGRRLERHAAAFSALPGYPELDLGALKMTYRDAATELALPVFAVFPRQGWLPELGDGGGSRTQGNANAWRPGPNGIYPCPFSGHS